ncbi:hypothetical protein GCM10010521_13090 [Streptomyces rameus]|uniref:Uncharacterized protein n=1 Tax=Streptomyces rameus TaxID=68261 RepID=A0ABP6MWB4_9ACTN
MSVLPVIPDATEAPAPWLVPVRHGPCPCTGLPAPVAGAVRARACEAAAFVALAGCGPPELTRRPDQSGAEPVGRTVPR